MRRSELKAVLIRLIRYGLLALSRQYRQVEAVPRMEKATPYVVIVQKLTRPSLFFLIKDLVLPEMLSRCGILKWNIEVTDAC